MNFVLHCIEMCLKEGEDSLHIILLLCTCRVRAALALYSLPKNTTVVFYEGFL